MDRLVKELEPEYGRLAISFGSDLRAGVDERGLSFAIFVVTMFDGSKCGAQRVLRCICYRKKVGDWYLHC